MPMPEDEMESSLKILNGFNCKYEKFVSDPESLYSS